MSSLPRQVPSPSSPSSSPPPKSFLRPPSAAGPQQQQQPKGLLPSPYFEEPIPRTPATRTATVASHDDDPVIPTEAEAEAEAEAEGAAAAVGDFGGLAAFASGSASAPAQALIDFQPFFALVEDTVTREHYHPTVHYIFADDEPDIITEAACRSLEQQRDDDDDGDDAVVVGGGGGAAGESRYLPRPAAGVKEHYVVLDVHPVSSLDADATRATATLAVPASAGATGAAGAAVAATATTTTAYEVVRAQSLSSEWQVLKTNITSAPTIGEQDGDEGLMLRIEGRGHTPTDAPLARAGERQQQQQESVEDLIERFQKRLDDIRHVMLAGRGQERGGEDEG